MKRLLCILVCILLCFSYITSCTAEKPTNKQIEYVIGGIYIYNIPEKTPPDILPSIASPITAESVRGEYIATGDKLKDASGKVYTAVIYGDVNGDGVIDSYDYILVKRACMETVELNGEYAEAAKRGDDISAFDYILIKRHVMNTYDLSSTLHREPQKIDANGVKIAYIPLDNRPVNKDRVEYLAAASGFELLVPEEDLYRTALDNMTPNSDGSTIGNRQKLLEWLKSVENECDYYVISLDQLISGGLVGSRYLSNTDLSFETEVADYIISLSAKKHVVLFDTVMRLASTVGYKGYDMETYNKLRSYGQVARKQLVGKDLTVENIVAGYRSDANGKTVNAGVSSTVLDQYLASRERKLRIIDYLLSNAVEDIERIYIGVDDSSPQTTIQTNEINYITSLGGENMTLFAGADELGLMGIAAIAGEVYGYADCKVTYFGEGKYQPADSFDTATLGECIDKHFSAIGARSNSSKENALQVLVLTKSSSLSKNADALMKTAVDNLSKGIPTCIIDASAENRTLPRKMLDYDYEIAKILGYSNWNTVANATGISLSNAVARYLYIYKGATVTEESNEAFLKTLAFSLVKDISYKCCGIKNLRDTSNYGPATIISRINESGMLGKNGERISHKKVSVSNFRYPWNRTFEATFDITVK